MAEFIDRLCDAVFEADGGDADSRALLGRGIADTVAVAAAGFAQPITRSAMQAYGGATVRAWSGEYCESREAAVMINSCLLYTSDAADDLLCVDLGGRRIIKKK